MQKEEQKFNLEYADDLEGSCGASALRKTDNSKIVAKKNFVIKKKITQREEYLRTMLGFKER